MILSAKDPTPSSSRKYQSDVLQHFLALHGWPKLSCQESLENLTYCKSNYVQQVDISTCSRCGLDSKSTHGSHRTRPCNYVAFLDTHSKLLWLASDYSKSNWWGETVLDISQPILTGHLHSCSLLWHLTAKWPSFLHCQRNLMISRVRVTNFSLHLLV